MSGPNILVVEDEKIVALDIKNRLIDFGYNVPAIVSSGEDAVEKAGDLLPDLILMDIMLKGDMDGIEAAEQIHELYDIPIVYLTAYADEKTLERAKVTEPFGYILKPFEERELRTNIEIALYKHRMERKLKERERWLTATVNCVSDALIATDNDGNLKLINPFAQLLTGWSEEEAIGKPLKDVFNIINGNTGEAAGDPVMKVMSEGAFYGLEDSTTLITKYGTRIPLDVIGSPIKDERDDIIGTVIVFYDISERRHTEEMLKVDAGLVSL